MKTLVYWRNDKSISVLAWRPLRVLGGVTASQKIILHAVNARWKLLSRHGHSTREQSKAKDRAPRGGGGVRSRGFEQTCRNIPTTFHTIFNYSGQMGFGEDFLKLKRFLHIYFYVKTILKLNPPLWSYNSLGDNDLYKVESTIFILYIFILSTHIIRTHSNKHMRVDQIKVIDPTRRNKLLQNIFVIVKHLNESCPLCRYTPIDIL